MVDPLGNHKDGVFGPCGGHTVTQSNIWAQCHPFRNQIHDKIRTQHTYTHKTHLHVLCLQQWQDSQPRLGILTARVLQIAKCCFDYLLNIFILYSFIFYCSENAHENGRRLRNDQHVQSCLRVNSSKYA